MKYINRMELEESTHGFMAHEDFELIFLRDDTWMLIVEYGMYENSGVFYDVSNNKPWGM